jgi:hypothetical protein
MAEYICSPSNRMHETPPQLQAGCDEEHLKLLSIFHFIVGGARVVVASVFIFLFVMAPLFGERTSTSAVPSAHVLPPIVGYLFASVTAVFLLG